MLVGFLGREVAGPDTGDVGTDTIPARSFMSASADLYAQGQVSGTPDEVGEEAVRIMQDVIEVWTSPPNAPIHDSAQGLRQSTHTYSTDEECGVLRRGQPQGPRLAAAHSPKAVGAYSATKFTLPGHIGRTGATLDCRHIRAGTSLGSSGWPVRPGEY